MRFEMEKTWETSRRLNYWAKRSGELKQNNDGDPKHMKWDEDKLVR